MGVRTIIRLAGTVALTACIAASGYILAHPVPVVLMFHSVRQDAQGQDVSPARFNGLLASLRDARERPVLTTDSSDETVYHSFVPDARAEGLPAILFLMPPVIDRAGMLTWDQVRELDRDGLAIGSHTMTHPWLPDLSDDELRCEVCTSKAVLEAQLQKPVTLLAYPYGAFDARVLRTVQECGYQRAYATAPGRRVADDDPFAIKRVAMSEAILANGWLRAFALSGYWITMRELVLTVVPVEVPRKPRDWSYRQWQQTEKKRLNRWCRFD